MAVDQHKLRRRAAEDEPWPEIFRRRMPPTDPPEIAEHWKNYRSTGDPSARLALFNFYARLIAIAVCRWKRRRPETFREPAVDLFNDGAIALLRWIDNHAARPYEPGLLRHLCLVEMKRSVWREAANRIFGSSHRQHSKRKVIADFRAHFIREHGRVPFRSEIIEHLRSLFLNPAYAFDHLMPITPAASLTEDDDDLFRRSIAAGAPPEQRAMTADLVRLALKGLRGQDRKIFKMLLCGIHPSEIARRLKVCGGTLHNRVNGLLWEARSRADLAKYVGAEPSPMPPKSSHRIFPAFHLKDALRAVG